MSAIIAKRRLVRAALLCLGGGMFLALANGPVIAPLGAASGAMPEGLAVSEADVNGAVRALQSRGHWLSGAVQWLPVTLGDVRERALASNPTLKRGALAVESARSAHRAMDALAFDPVLSAGIDYSYFKNLERTTHDWKWKKASTVCTGSESIECLDEEAALAPGSQDVFVVFGIDSPVAFLQYDKARREGYYWSSVEASTADVTGPSKSTTYSVGLFQALPWGSTVSVNESNVYQKAFWSENADTPNPTVGRYNLPWSSSLAASASVPVPFMKNWGRHAVREVAVAQSGLTVESSRASLETTRESVLLQVDQAYWELVSAARVLHATSANRERMAQLVKRTRRQFKEGVVILYAKLQVESELARVEGEETTAWNNYVMASNALKQLLAAREEVLLLPVGYTELAASQEQVTLDEALERAMAGNPALQVGKLSTASARLSHKGNQTQAMPNLSLSLSATVSESNAPFGYKDLHDAIGRLTTPDEVSLTGTVGYSYPWANRAAEATVAQSRESVAASRVGERIIENAVQRQVKDAYASLMSSRERIAITERGVRMATEAYAKAARLRDLGRLTEYELVVRNGEVLEASKRHILAQVAAKKAESALLAAMGALARQAAELGVQAAVEPLEPVVLAAHDSGMAGGGVQ